MIRIFFLAIFRNMKRNKIYTLINLAGLVIGLVTYILISLYVSFEFSFDKFHPNFPNLYRVEVDFDGRGRMVGLTYGAMASTLTGNYPDIQAATRFINFGRRQTLTAEQAKPVPQQRGYWAENSFFSVFGFKLLQGDPVRVLDEPFTVVLSKNLAESLFPGQNPLGQIVRINRDEIYTVRGVTDNCPLNSHIQFDFLGSYTTQNHLFGEGYTESWDRSSCYTYVVLEPNTPLSEINLKIKNLFQTHVSEYIPTLVYLKPLRDIHFHSRVFGEFGPVGDLSQVRTSLGIGFFVLLIACINFMNLSTARSGQHAKEISLRKIVGATRISLIGQQLVESILFALLALFAALFITELLLPQFSTLIGRELTFKLAGNGVLILNILGMTLLVGIIAGSYPALFISSFQPIRVLKEGCYTGFRGQLVRKALVVFQFTISVLLIFGTIVVYKQMQFIQNKDLGVCTDQTLIVSMPDAQPETLRRCEIFRSAIANLPGVLSTAISRFNPSYNGAATVIQGWDDSAEGDELYVNINWVDHHFLDSYGIELLAGRNFSEHLSAADYDNCLINETAARRLGWADPVGKMLGGKLKVIGLFSDFHFASLRYPIEPLILYWIGQPGPNPRIGHQLSIRLSGRDTGATIAALETHYRQIFNSESLRYQFLDEQLKQIYTTEYRTSKTITSLAVIAVFIACLGLFGLASYTTEQRTREIGIRKVLGSTVVQSISLFLLEFIKWVLLANLIAWPVAGLVMQHWLQGFAYRTQLSWWIFAVSGLTALMIAILTVIFQTIRAALINPIESLRYE